MIWVAFVVRTLTINNIILLNFSKWTTLPSINDRVSKLYHVWSKFTPINDKEEKRITAAFNYIHVFYCNDGWTSSINDAIRNKIILFWILLFCMYNVPLIVSLIFEIHLLGKIHWAKTNIKILSILINDGLL